MVVSKAPSARTFLCIAVALVAALSFATKQVGAAYTRQCPKLNEFCDGPDSTNTGDFKILESCWSPDDKSTEPANLANLGGGPGAFVVGQFGTGDLSELFNCPNLDVYDDYVNCVVTGLIDRNYAGYGSIFTKLGGCGCTEEGAINYDQNAIANYPGYCKFPPKKGCTDEEADNYDPLAVDDDGTCIFPRIAEVHGGTHANATGHIQSIGGNAVSTLLDGLSAATTIAESASAIIGGSGPSAKANVAAHTRGANTYRLGTAARTRSTTHQNKMHYSTHGTSNTHFDGYAYGKKKDDESTEGAHGADVSLVSPHFSGGYASVGSGYGKDYHAYAGQKESLRATGYKLPYSIPVEAITNQYYHHYSGR